MERLANISELDDLRESILKKRDPNKLCVSVCKGTGCTASESPAVVAAFEQELKKSNLKEKVDLRVTGCHGFCEHGPLVVIFPRKIFYQRVAPGDVPEIVEKTLLKGEIVERLLYVDPNTNERVLTEDEVPFYKKQQRILLANNGRIDPTNIEDYLAVGGYEALKKVLSGMTPEDIIEIIKKAGLRGRGGAGFPTGRKWELCRANPEEPKYIVCNADEGDPGAYMDRSILEGNPHSVMEGMIIGAFAIGARESYVYVRAEYPLAIANLRVAIKQAEELGLLGENILGSGFSFKINIFEGAGAFVCGEETALIASIEGTTGEPRQRPPFPAQKGLWEKPTNINNVKTWANVPLIISRGADWFASMGTEKSKGTMVFSLVGKVKNTGLVEVPMGGRISDLVFEIGGGIVKDRKFKAVQTGGPSGGCIPVHLADLPVDYEKLAEVGSIMGSGGMVVMDENTCMVNVAKYFLTFTKDESCGKCTPCREGIKRMLEILTDITEGRGREGDIELLEDMGKTVIDSALCALGGTAPKPVLSTIRYFRKEYEDHIKYKRCPAGVCRKIISSACQHICPLGTDVPAYVALIAKGQFAEAAQAIRKTNPLPNICARVCHHPCESKCAAGEAGDPIAIKDLKRFAMDYERKALKASSVEPPQVQYEKVAIIGSGPAGLTAGYFLTQQGYDVTIFEAASRPGGMLALAIPEYRLPSEILGLDIESIKKSGVKIKTKTRLGKDISIDDIFQQGFKGIFLACGAHKSLKLGIPGEDLQGVVDPLELLRNVKFGKKVKVGKKVGIVGGGNAAIDAARTALRLGAKSVHILYRRTKMEMPAAIDEVEGALKEGVKIEFLVAPSKVISSNGKLTGLECVRMELGEFDQSGRRRPVPIKGSEFTVDLDILIPAIGQQPDKSFLGNGDGIKISRAGMIQVNPETLSTDREGVFAGGDAVSGPATVIEAMAAGKTAAESIHRYLRGIPLARKYEVTRPSIQVEPLEFSDEELERIAELPRAKPPEISLKRRQKEFTEVTGCLNKQAAMTEAKRCLRCDLQNGSK
jgi:NADH-quinone oxidoreductase subunit F